MLILFFDASKYYPRQQFIKMLSAIDYSTLAKEEKYTLILRKCGWSARIPVSKIAILTLLPVKPLVQSLSAPKREVTWDLCHKITNVT